MNSSQVSARAWKMPLRNWRITSGGAELGPIAKPAWIIFEADSSQIFWNAAACSAVFSKLLFSIGVQRGTSWCHTWIIYCRTLSQLDCHGHGFAASDAQAVDPNPPASFF